MKLLLKLFLFTICVIFLLSGCAPSLYESGRTALETNNLVPAEELLIHAVKSDSSNKDAWRDLGITQYKLKKYTEAENSLMQGYGLTEGETLFYLGLINEDRNDLDKAISIYKQSLSMNLDNEISSKIEGRISLVERKKMEQEIKAALERESSLSSENIPDNTIAVLLFQNLGGKRELDPLEKGLAEMVITDLSKVHDLKIVERIRLQKLLDEMKLSSGAQFDQSSAPRLGKLIQARTLIKGSFMDLESENLRMNANFIATKDGSYTSVQGITGAMQDYFKLQKDLVFSLIDNMGIKLSDEEREAIRIIPTESYLAFVAYCKGLDYEDKGLYSDAVTQYKEAANIDPSFKQAEVKINEVQNMNDAQTKFEATGDLFRGSGESQVIDRLSDSNFNLTGENVTGKDDRNPNSSQGFGRSVKVDIQVRLK